MTATKGTGEFVKVKCIQEGEVQIALRDGAFSYYGSDECLVLSMRIASGRAVYLEHPAVMSLRVQNVPARIYLRDREVNETHKKKRATILEFEGREGFTVMCGEAYNGHLIVTLVKLRGEDEEA